MDRNEITVVVGKPDDKIIFRNLMQLYEYDFSEFTGDDPNSHGLFDSPYLDHYFTPSAALPAPVVNPVGHPRLSQAEGFVPFLIRVNNQIGGYALKSKWSCLGRADTDHWMNDFFVMRKWRRRGIGRQVAFELFRRFPGVWEVGQMRANVPAQHFWATVIGEYTRGQFENIESFPPGWDGYVQVFRSE